MPTQYSSSASSREVIIDLQVNAKDAVEAIVHATDAINNLKKEQKELEAVMKRGEGTEDQKKRLVMLKTEMRDLQTVVKANEKELNNQVQQYKKNGDSINALRAQLRTLRQQYEDLSAAERDGAKGQELLNKISGLTTQVKGFEQAQGDFSRSVGSYGKLFDSSAQSMQQFGNVFASVFGSNSIVGKAATVISGFGKNLQNVSKDMSSVTDSSKTMGSSINLTTSDMQQLNNVSGEARTVVQGFAGSEQQAATATTAMGNVVGKLPTLFKSAASGAAALGKQLLALMANPIVAVIAGIVAIIIKLVEQFKKNDEAMTALNRAFSAFKPVMDLINKGFQLLVGVLTKVVNVFADVVNGIMSVIPGMKEYAEAEDDIVVSTDKLEEAQRQYMVSHAERESKISELRNKSLESEKYSVEQRREFLQQALDLEKEDIEEKRKNAKEELRIAENKALMEIGYTEMTEEAWSKLSDKEKDAISQLRVNVIGLDAEFNNATRRMTSQMNNFDKQINSERDEQNKKAEAAAKDRAQKEKEILQELEDLTIASIKDINKKEEEQTRISYNRRIDKLKERLRTEKNLTVIAKNGLNQQIILLEAELQEKLSEIAEKNEQERIKKTIDYQKNYWQEVLKGAIGDEAVEAERAMNELAYKTTISPWEQRLKELNKLYDDNNVRWTEELNNELIYVENVIELIKKNYQQADTEIVNNGKKAKDLIKRQNEDLIAQLTDEKFLQLYGDDEVKKTQIFEQQARRRLEIAQRELDELKANKEELGLTDDEYNNKVLQGELAIVQAQNDLKQAVNESNAALIAQKQRVYDAAMEIANATETMINGLSNLFEMMAEDNDKYTKYAKGLAMTQIVLNAAVASAQALVAAINAGKDLGLGAAVAIPIFLAEFMGIVTGAIVSAKNILKQDTQPQKPTFAVGGLVGNQTTTRTDDTVDAKLSVGEYVIRSSVVKDIGVDFFNKINNGRGDKTNRFATGGIVPSISSISSADTTLDYRQLEDIMISIVENIHPQVSVNEINTMQQRVLVKEQNAKYM